MKDKDSSIINALDVISKKDIFILEELELIEKWKTFYNPQKELIKDLNECNPIALSIFKKISCENHVNQ